MGVFTGGSAYAMIRDIADGFVIPSEPTFKHFGPQDFTVFAQESDRLLREVRSSQPPATDAEATRTRQRRMQRITQAMAIARGVQSRR